MAKGVCVRTEEHVRHIKEANIKRIKGKTWEQLYGKDVAERMKKVAGEVMGKFNRECTDEKSPNWKGDDASYCAMHVTVRKYFGKATHCINPTCSGKSRYFEWSKKDHNTLYTRNVSDYQKLCRACHRGYDLGKIMINGRYGW